MNLAPAGDLRFGTASLFGIARAWGLRKSLRQGETDVETDERSVWVVAIVAARRLDTVAEFLLGAIGEVKDKKLDQYYKFYEQFGRILKEGVHSDFENYDKIKELLLFSSSKTEDGKHCFGEERWTKAGQRLSAEWWSSATALIRSKRSRM